MYAVGKDAFGPGDAKSVQSLHRSFAAAAQAVPGVCLVFRNVNMKPVALRAAGLLRLVRKCHTGVQSKSGGHPLRQRRTAHYTSKAYILANPRSRRLGTVPVRYFVTKHRPQPAGPTSAAIASRLPSIEFWLAWWSIRVVVPLRIASTRQTSAELCTPLRSSYRSSGHHSFCRISGKSLAGSPGIYIPLANAP